MSYSSIENKDIANLDNCENEPISVPGSIQPHGFLLALDQDQKVGYCTANLTAYDLSVEQVLGQELSSIFEKATYERIAAYLKNEVFDFTAPLAISIKGLDYNLTAHRSSTHLILEFEPQPLEKLSLPNLYLQTKQFTKTLSEANGLQHLCQKVAEEIKDITGYDRVMIYKFDEQYNGEVYAESKNEELETFMNLHYPHTDIPVQARQLYLTNLMRMIVDVSYVPVPILTLNTNSSHTDVDLSMAMLRSVSPIHCQYLKNMGVAGTLTISLIKDEKLWGLVACHHYSGPKNVPYFNRVSALLQGQFLTTQIRVQEVAESYQAKLQLDKHLKNYQDFLNSENNSPEAYLGHPEVLPLCNADGFLIRQASEVIASEGVVPDEKEIKKLVKKLKNHEFYTSSSLLADLNFENQSNISGVLYYKLTDKTHIFWFRKEQNKVINWAGEPEKAILKDPNGLGPRNSFATWQQTIKNQSFKWTEIEINAANQCIYALQRQLNYRKAEMTRRSQKRLLAKLKLANEELENINWISTHDLKEPLRKIRIFASLLTGDNKYEVDEGTMNILDKITGSAERMQILLDDLLTFARTKNGKYDYEEVALSKVLDTVIQNFKDRFDAKDSELIIAPLPTIKGVRILLNQLFVNLLSNSIKFSKEDEPLKITITHKEETDENDLKWHLMTFQDNGLGFSNEYADLIFQVFQRLNDKSTVEGTGIGLAICKKIVEAHKGEISASGEINNGATFMIKLPEDPDLIISYENELLNP